MSRSSKGKKVGVSYHELTADTKELDALKAKWATTALDIIHVQFPAKLLFLQDKLKSTMFTANPSEAAQATKDFAAEVQKRVDAAKAAHSSSSSSSSTSSSSQPSKKRKLHQVASALSSASSSKGKDADAMEADSDSSSDDSSPELSPRQSTSLYSGDDSLLLLEVPCNPKIIEISEFLKEELLQLIDMLDTIKIWVQLNIPRIESGGDFGVSIQEETISELGRAEDMCFTSLDNINKYHATRGKLITKVLKHPGVMDYAQSIIELDEKEFTNLRLTGVDLRNSVISLYDYINKNMEKIQKPRSDSYLVNLSM